MRLLFEAAVLCLTLGFGRCTKETPQENTVHQTPQAESSYSDWGIGAIRDSFEMVNSYFDSFLELLGGKNGVCQYRCRYGKQTSLLLAPLFWPFPFSGRKSQHSPSTRPQPAPIHDLTPAMLGTEKPRQRATASLLAPAQGH